VGSDGRYAAVVSRANELLVLDAGKLVWRQKLKVLTLTAPLVAGGRVFTQSTDRSVSAFDASSGQRLWQQQKTGDSLVLGQSAC
jgi:outer membrane protein assembly factor BamB